MEDVARGTASPSPETPNRVGGAYPTREAWPRLLLALTFPLQAPWRRAVVEAVLGWFVLELLLGLVQLNRFPYFPLRGNIGHTWDFLTALAWMWAAFWLAWRTCQATGMHWWTRLLGGLWRFWLATLCVSTACLAITFVAEIGVPQFVVTSGRVFGTSAAFLFGASFLRMPIDLAAAARRWARIRLRRQLLVSYLLVIMVTFVGLAGVGILTAGVVVLNTLPDPASQARAIARMVAPAVGGSINRDRAQDLIQGVVSGRSRPVDLGGSPLNLFIPWDVINRRTELVDLRGRVLAAATYNRNEAGKCIEGHPNEVLPAAARTQLIHAALRRESASMPVPFTSTCNGGGIHESAAAAVVRGAYGQPIGVILVRGATLTPSGGAILGTSLLGFTAASMLLIVVTVVPTFILASLAAMYFARGLTRRIGALSRTASALSAGDLSQRVRVSAHNEIGSLAEDFNQMAERLEGIMGELRAARTEAENALHSRQELVASVSHELRTPIAVVQAHLESLQAASATGVPALTMLALQNEMDRLATLVDDLFVLARAGTTAMRVHNAPTDVGDVVREVAALLRPLAQREGALTITAEAAPGLPPAMADGDRLRQILANLVRNAVRHTPEGGIIALGAASEEGWLVVSVADTGEGIAPEHLPRIFDRFYRVDKARTRSSGGAGLGLAIVKEFVELMGGHVKVESRPGEGTIFRVYLPRAHDASESTSTAADRRGSVLHMS